MKNRIVILGGGESGVGAALLAKSREYEVFLSDGGNIPESYQEELNANNIPFETGKHSTARILAADTIVKSPGIAEEAEIVVTARAAGCEIISEIEFAFRHTKAKVVGITGTNGKTTTTQMIYHLLKSGGYRVAACGNIGSSMAREVVEDMQDWLVVELSSFQLDDVDSFHPQVAVMLNITPDHLNRYNDFDDYVAAKWNLFRNMTPEDQVVYWADDPVVGSMMGKEGVDTQKVPVSLTDKDVDFHKEEGRLQFGDHTIKLSKLTFTGDHNYINCMCAVAVALGAGVSFKTIKKGLKSFHGIPHRMEYIDTIDGVSFVNDSKATNVEAVFYALDAYPGPITWIAGGEDKGNDYNKIMALVEQKVKALICLGVNNEKIKEAFKTATPIISETRDIKEALQMAQMYSSANDVVLLSPACASFDLFKNYEDRGDQFRKGVTQLKEMANKPSEI